MKQIVIRTTGGPEVLKLDEVPDPIPQDGEILVRAEAIGVGWPDILIRKGTYKWMPPLPVSPGSELAGKVESVGAGVTDFHPGSAVLVSARELATRGGCYAEKIAVPASSVFRLPSSVRSDQAACLGNFQVASALLIETVSARKPRSVLVVGAAGGIGSAAVQIARLVGMTVIGTVSSDAKAAFAVAQGAHYTLNYRSEKVVERVLALTEGRGVDLILDHIGGPNFADNLAMLANWGTIVSYNAQRGSPPHFFEDLRANVSKSPSIRCFSMHCYDEDREPRRRIMQEAIELLSHGRISPPIGAVLPMSEAAEAHRLIESGDVNGRVLLRPD